MDQQIGNELPPLHNPEQASPAPFEGQGATESYEQQGAQHLEQGISQAAPMAAPISQPAIQIPLPTAAMPAIQGLPTAAGTPQIADDTDLIEKEWVVKAKEIVARTKHDPYQQNKQVEVMKADYMKKRYNKDIKVTED